MGHWVIVHCLELCSLIWIKVISLFILSWNPHWLLFIFTVFRVIYQLFENKQEDNKMNIARLMIAKELNLEG